MRKGLQYGFAVFSALLLIQTVIKEDVCMGMLHRGLSEAETYEVQNISEAMEAVRPSLVKIQTEGYYGSGTIWRITEEEIILVSNKHLLSLADACKVTFHTADTVEGTVFGLSDAYDVGFVSVPLQALSHDTLQKLRCSAVDRQCCEALQKGDEMFVAGVSDGTEIKTYSGVVAHTDWYVEEFDANMLYLYCYGEEGMSGGGTYDAHGHYIGMLTGGFGEEIVSLPAAVVTEAYEAAEKERAAVTQAKV